MATATRPIANIHSLRRLLICCGRIIIAIVTIIIAIAIIIECNFPLVSYLHVAHKHR